MNKTHTEKAWFKSALENKNLCDALGTIRLIISDVDGCLTDNKMLLSQSIEGAKTFNFGDGMITRAAQEVGLHLALISSSRTTQAATQKRAKRIGIPDELCKIVPSEDKLKTAEKILGHLELDRSEVLTLGDDHIDLALKEVSILFATPHSSLFYIQDQSDIILPRAGGNGAFRLLLDLVLYIQDKHPLQSIIDESLQKS